MLKQSLLALILMGVAIAAMVYGAAPSLKQEYLLDDVAFYARQLADQQSYALGPAFFYFLTLVKNTSGLEPLAAVRASKFFFLFGVLGFFLLTRLLTKSVPLALAATFLFVFNAYHFNLLTVALRQMFANVFLVWFSFASLQLLGAAEKPWLDFLKRHPVELATCAALFLAIAASHEITFLSALLSLPIFAFLAFAGGEKMQRMAGAYLAAAFLAVVLSVNLLALLLNHFMPYYLDNSKVVYGTGILTANMTALKAGLIVFFSLLILSYAWLAFRERRRPSVQQKLLYWLGVVSLVLLVFPVGWTAPALVFFLGFYLVFYYFYGLLWRQPSIAELFVIALFAASTLLSRNAFLGLDFYMLRFEAELSLPFLALAALGLKGILGDYRNGRLSLPVIERLRGLAFPRGAKWLVAGLLASAFLSNIFVVQSVISSSMGRGTDTYKQILNCDYFGQLKEADVLATNEIVGLYPRLGKTIHLLAPFWGGKLDKAVKDLSDTGIDFVVVGGAENQQIINFGEFTEFFARTYSNLQTANFDKTYDTGIVTAYAFNFNGAYYYTADQQLAPWKG